MAELPYHIQRSICPSCEHCRVVRSGKGSVFLMCQQGTPPKYPAQPVVQCDYELPKRIDSGEQTKTDDSENTD